mgnify:CR=1 FL=1
MCGCWWEGGVHSHLYSVRQDVAGKQQQHNTTQLQQQIHCMQKGGVCTANQCMACSLKQFTDSCVLP